MSYKSKAQFLGLPLVHVATSTVENGRLKRGIARGWIAVGDVSFGVLLSVGGVAFGGIAIGGLAVGLVSIAGLALGLLALGGGALGLVAIGGAALAWKYALGGFAMAHEYAVGGSAFAIHANDLAAKDYFNQSPLFSTARWLADHARWFLLLALLPIVQALRHRRKTPDPQ